MGHAPHHYLDCSATTPLAPEVQQAMLRCHAEAWANPSSLHGLGLTAAEQLERQRQRLGVLLGCESGRVVFTSGGTESIHLGILGACRGIGPAGPAGSRLLISSVEHPATVAAAAQLEREGWLVEQLPVSRMGLLDLEQLKPLLAPPTRLVSLIWGQSEVGTVQPLEQIGALCRGAGVPLHVDAVQVIGHQPVRFDALPVDLLSLTAHKLQGPRGVGALLVRSGLPLAPLWGGGGQEGGLRSGTEPVDLVTGLVEAVALSQGRLEANGGDDPIRPLRDALLGQLLRIPGLELTGVDPRQGAAAARLPHHISLVVRNHQGTPRSGRRLVQQLWREGFAASSGSACSSGAERPSPVLLAMGYDAAEAQAGLRLSLGPWHRPDLLDQLPPALEQALQRSGL